MCSNTERTKDMIRFILVCITVIGYLVLTIPVLLIEWIIGEIRPHEKGYQLPAHGTGHL